MLEKFFLITKSIQKIKDPNQEVTNGTYVAMLMEQIEHLKQENKIKNSIIQSPANQYNNVFNNSITCDSNNNNDINNSNNNNNNNDINPPRSNNNLSTYNSNNSNNNNNNNFTNNNDNNNNPYTSNNNLQNTFNNIILIILLKITIMTFL